MDTTADINPELESFREQWRAEVRAKQPTTSGSQHQSSSTSTNQAETSRRITAPGPPPRPTAHLSHGKLKALDTDDDYVEPLAFDDPETAKSVQSISPPDKEDGEPVTALDHYERAVEKESQGSLGDSLMLYRKAFRVRPISLRLTWPRH